MQKTDFRDSAGKLINVAEVAADATADNNVLDRDGVRITDPRFSWNKATQSGRATRFPTLSNRTLPVVHKVPDTVPGRVAQFVFAPPRALRCAHRPVPLRFDGHQHVSVLGFPW